MKRAKYKRRQNRQHVRLPGHELGALVDGPDPQSGARVVHAINLTGRRIDILREAGAITQAQYLAGTDLRDTWERAQPIKPVRAAAVAAAERREEHCPDPEAEMMVSRILGALSAIERAVVQAVIFHDMAPADDPRGWRVFEPALDRLARTYGYG